MPSPGNGANTIGDAPQEFLFLITDGADDDPKNGAGVLNTSACNAIKARGIKIGVVYPTYFAVPGFFAYDQDVAPIQSQIRPNLASCASSPAYYAEVNADGDISAALKQIFTNFTHNPHLTN